VITQPTLPFFDLQSLLDMLSDELMSILNISVAVPSTETSLKIFLVRDIPSMRFNLIADPIEISELWGIIRGNDSVTDLVLDLTTTLRLHVGAMGPDAWTELKVLVSSALSVFNSSEVHADESTIAEFDSLDRYVNETDAVTYVASNPWLITIFLIKQTEVYKKFCAEMAEHARKVSFDKKSDVSQ
jgi:hypothetical protein